MYAILPPPILNIYKLNNMRADMNERSRAMAMKVNGESNIGYSQGTNVQGNEKENKNDKSKITIFAKDGVLDVKEQQKLLQDSVNADTTIQSAIQKGFEINGEIKKESEFLSDYKLLKDENNSYNTAIAWAQKRIQRAVNSIKEVAVKFLQANGTQEIIKDESGNDAGISYKDANGEIYETLEYERDEAGNTRKHIRKDKSGNIISLTELNSKGLRTHSVEYAKDNSSIEYNYDDNGDEKQRILKDKDGNVIQVLNGNKSQNDFSILMSKAKEIF